MKKLRTIILFALMVTAVACTPRGIISKKKMARINAEMFLFDQYAGADREIRHITDTVAIYKALFRSFGVTSEQYFASVDHYLDNTRDMEKILAMTEDILTRRQAKIMKRIEKAAIKQDTTAIRNTIRHTREKLPDVEELKR